MLTIGDLFPASAADEERPAAVARLVREAVRFAEEIDRLPGWLDEAGVDLPDDGALLAAIEDVERPARAPRTLAELPAWLARQHPARFCSADLMGDGAALFSNSAVVRHTSARYCGQACRRAAERARDRARKAGAA